jgi:osmoprotectant transport system ATP-binding protein
VPKDMIQLEGLTKRYSGQREPAVDNISMDIPEGEIVVLVGPSGCGKTTTLKMINRLIEPTSGTIHLDGEDVTRIDPKNLRRRSGYVIQQIGLFPHMKVAQNVGVVPSMLGWDKGRIAERVDELLELVGLDPGTYRNQYPKQLSGGQQQRVGVARALAADPPVLLMDEPFGALDPITRDHLQNELLRIQEGVRKTIVLVSHDIDEAIKLGDRIAVLAQNAHIAQYDTPDRLLSSPANDFVEKFVGSGAAVRRLSLTRVRDVELEEPVTVLPDEDPSVIRARLQEAGTWAVLLVDEQKRPLRWVTLRDIESGKKPEETGVRVEAMIPPRATLHDALDEMLTAFGTVVLVVDDEDGALLGSLPMESLLRSIQPTGAEQTGLGAGEGR